MTRSLWDQGFDIRKGAVQLADLETLSRAFDGTRCARQHSLSADLSQFVWSGSAIAIAKEMLGPMARPVRVILFDKSAETNWNLGWHQDRVISVKFRASVPGFENWTCKGGAFHVEPPFEIIEKMISIRAHLDDCTRENGALEIIPESHCVGKVNDAETKMIAERDSGTIVECERGDFIVLSTPIIHRSGRSKSSGRRRVVHIDYSAAVLPPPLEWALEKASIEAVSV